MSLGIDRSVPSFRNASLPCLSLSSTSYVKTGMGKVVGHGCERAAGGSEWVADGSEWMLGEVDGDDDSLKLPCLHWTLTMYLERG